MADHRRGATVREYPDRSGDRRELPLRGRRRSKCLRARRREPYREGRGATRHDQPGAELADDLEVTRPRGAVLDGEHDGPVGTECRDTAIVLPVSCTRTGTTASVSDPAAAAPPTAATAAITAVAHDAPDTEILRRCDVKTFRT